MSTLGRLAVASVAALVGASPGYAALFRRNPAGNRTSRITLAKRLHVNTLITEPDTVEVDWTNLYSFPTFGFGMPSAIKYTPSGTNVLWGRTEYSVAFDALRSDDRDYHRVTQFGQAVTATATVVLHDGQKLDIALAPQATFFLRNEPGVRLGATAIARYDFGRNSLGATAGWSAATHASDSNPAGILDVGFGFGHQLSGSRLLEKFTPHINGDWERASSSPSAALIFEGVEFQATDRLAFDLSAQHSTGGGNAPDHQLAFGITFNLGTMH